ncbi:hypothetical protein ACX801_12545 [Arthrobacter bambusae]
MSLGMSWSPLRCNQVFGRPLRGRLWGPGRAVAGLRTPWPFFVYDDAPIVVKLDFDSDLKGFPETSSGLEVVAQLGIH